MELSGLHILLTYACNFSCEHCFVWGSPSQKGTWAWADLQNLLQQTQSIPSVKKVYFEGGEPFLYYPLLLKGVKTASNLGFQVGIVSNAYWATTVDDARLWLEPFLGSLRSLSISSDLYHGEEDPNPWADHALQAAQEAGLQAGMISIALPQDPSAPAVKGMLPDDRSQVRYRGRAASTLAERSHHSKPWTAFDSCPYENLRHPSRVHVDPLGYLHICQGISAGNIFRDALEKLCAAYQPEKHPILGPLLQGGPAALFRSHSLPVNGSFADACHLCDTARHRLRDRFPDILVPDQMYGDGQ